MALRLDNLLIEMKGFRLSTNLEVKPGQRLAVIGPSGAGKSTLFDVIAGFLSPSAGRVVWQGHALTAPPGKRPVAMVFQDNNLFPHLTVRRNVGLALSQKARLTGAQRDQVAQVLAKVGLRGLEDRLPSQLSGGQQSRVALARLLLQDRPIWLLDEPFAALGPALKSEMIALVKTISQEQGATVLMITHDPADAQELSDTCLLVAEGQVTGPHDTGALFADPPPILREYLGSRA